MAYTIAYVMSLPHSGSTLCGSLLGAHSRAFSLGEPWKLQQYALLARASTHKTALGNACTCGAPNIWECPFWPKVDAAVRKAAGIGLRELDTASADQATFVRNNKLMFDAVAEVTGATLLVDSSKRVERLRQLLAGDFAVTVLHLVRNPRGQVLSNMKRTGRGPYRHAVRNAIDTARMMLVARGARTMPSSYERIASDPEGWLREVMPKFGLEFEPRQLEWATLPRHNISGNQSRATKDNTIKVDRSWESGLSGVHRAYIDLVAGSVARLAGGGRASV